MQLSGLLFDKDGTLFDFGGTWNVWASDLIKELTPAKADAIRLANAMDFNLDEGRFNPTSPIIAGTGREAAECVARGYEGMSLPELEGFLSLRASQAPLVEAVPLAPYLKNLRAKGVSLGVMTNDTEAAAHAHLDAFGVRCLFDFVAGFDSGFGAKPAPDPLLAFARQVSLEPDRIAMVGDSTHDLVAGRAAGMKTIAVLTGIVSPAELSPYADLVLDHIGLIPDHVDLVAHS